MPVSKSDKTIWGQIYWLDIVYIIQSYICVSHSTSGTYTDVYMYRDANPFYRGCTKSVQHVQIVNRFA
jgi:hypothetical protein